MKAGDFIFEIQGGEVNFEHSRIKIQEAARDTLAGALSELLDGDATVYYAYELSRFRRIGGVFEGTLDWIVVLDSAVLRIVGKGEPIENEPALHLAEHLLPARTLVALVVEPRYVEYLSRVHLQSVSLKAQFVEGTIEASAELPEGNAEGLLRLGRELRRLLDGS